ncbi:MAG: type II secretion system protein [Hydrogenophaga sp.]|uniref:type IV pilus modification PilV family protein n=1 Tax=Hydrogenophaga sp. TaxID=1904254 RepID=UPI002AB90B47|nr:type II secretion system protein [Hydrogenophaga sp.]MDZ4187682.1 type II secretion system protein [Hydrogenophaga sp.]
MNRPALSLREVTRQAGISLLEVLAALVILSIGASVAFTWFGQSVTAMGRIKAEEKGLLARNHAMEYLRAVNPVDQPTGEIEMPGYRLSWTSRPIRDVVRTLTPLGTPSRYEVSLYELDVRLARPDDDTPWSEFQLQLAGYRQVAPSSMGGMFGASGAGATP